MRSADELIDRADPGWPTVQQWLRDARNAVDVLPVDRARARRTLEAIQVTTRSPMGAIAYETGGLLIDGGWVRVLASGCERLRGDLASWNGLGEAPVLPALAGKFVIAHDVLGGVFALGAETRTVFYFAPDSLEWEDLERGYSDVVGGLLLQGDLEGFYGSYRWAGWREDVAKLGGDRGFSIYPPLWSEEGKDVANQSRRPAPMLELFPAALDIKAQLGLSSR